MGAGVAGPRQLVTWGRTSGRCSRTSLQGDGAHRPSAGVCRRREFQGCGCRPHQEREGAHAGSVQKASPGRGSCCPRPDAPTGRQGRVRAGPRPASTLPGRPALATRLTGTAEEPELRPRGPTRSAPGGGEDQTRPRASPASPVLSPFLFSFKMTGDPGGGVQAAVCARVVTSHV